MAARAHLPAGGTLVLVARSARAVARDGIGDEPLPLRVGVGLSGVAAINSAAQGKYGETGLSVLGMIPGGAAILAALARNAERARRRTKFDEAFANTADVIIGPGATVLQKLSPPGDDRPPSCEPPRPAPLRIPSLHAR